MGKSSYRNLHVDGVDYKYVIGDKNVKIVGPNGIDIVDKRKMSVSGLRTGLVTTPGMVARFIQGQEINAEDFFHSCEHEGRVLRINPLMIELYGKVEYRVICQDCYNKMADDI